MRKLYLVTVKMARNPEHNPHDKKTGPCPATGLVCTDSTGEHHTVLVRAETVDQAREVAGWNWSHITRIEEVE